MSRESSTVHKYIHTKNKQQITHKHINKYIHPIFHTFIHTFTLHLYIVHSLVLLPFKYAFINSHFHPFDYKKKEWITYPKLMTPGIGDQLLSVLHLGETHYHILSVLAWLHIFNKDEMKINDVQFTLFIHSIYKILSADCSNGTTCRLLHKTNNTFMKFKQQMPN